MLTGTDSSATIRTWPSRSAFDICHPDPQLIHIEDIAHHLSMLCRYVGGVKRFYSVAEHCVLVSMCCGNNPSIQLWGLLHDAPETWMGDLSTPLKHLSELSAFRIYERRIQVAVCTRFNLPPAEPRIVSEIDKAIRNNEQLALQEIRPPRKLASNLLPVTLRYWSPREAEKIFLELFYDLNRQVEFMNGVPFTPVPRRFDLCRNHPSLPSTTVSLSV